MELNDAETAVDKGEDKHGDAQVPTVIKQGDVSTIEPAQGAQYQNKVQEYYGNDGGCPNNQRFCSNVSIHHKLETDQRKGQQGNPQQ